MTKSGDIWRVALASWAIPESILAQAPESPWIHPPQVFELPAVIANSPSHQKAREVDPASFLDIGCGGGIAAFATDAKLVIGVDHQPEMLEMFSNNAKARNREVQVFAGFWPAIGNQVSRAEVAAAHHVVYNVAEIEEFLLAMNSHATKRVVIEMPQTHPLSNLSAAWQHFWQLDRPTGPTPTELLKVLAELGITAHVEYWDGELRNSVSFEDQVRFNRIRLCLPENRDEEVREFMLANPSSGVRKLATIWWDIN